MIVFNVTVNIAEELTDDWLEWMKETHIPKIMDTGCFEHHKMLKLLNERPDVDGPTYAIQYFAKDMKTMTQFASKYDPILEKEVQARYGQKVMSFRTLLEEI